MHVITELTEQDFPFVSSKLDEWWGGRSMTAMLPRLWFKDFASTCFAVRGLDNNPIAFVVGYISQVDPTKSYVHFIGVNPINRNQGLGRLLCETFARKVFSMGATRIEAVTSPLNLSSLSFHESMGFMAKEQDGSLSKPTNASKHPDFDGVGEDRVVLIRSLPL